MSGIDIYFVMDESGSVGVSNYELMKQFVHNTVSEFDIGPDDTQVGVISYDSSARVEFYLNTYDNKTDLLSAINSLPFSGANTNTATAIDLFIPITLSLSSVSYFSFITSCLFIYWI